MLLYVAWLFMAQFLYIGLFGDDPPVSTSDFVNQLMTTRRGAGLMVYGIGLGFIFAFIALAISVIAFPLLLDKSATTATAVAISIRAVASNLMVMAGLGSGCRGAAGCGSSRVLDRPRGGPAYTGPCNVAPLPQSRWAVRHTRRTTLLRQI